MACLNKERGFDLAALLSLRCLFHRDSEEFSIACNTDDNGAFENIVLHQPYVNYIFLIKFHDKPTKLNDEDWLASNSDFSLVRYPTDLANSPFKCQPSTNICLIIYTNSFVSESEILEKNPPNPPYFLQTYTNNLYKLNIEKMSESIDLPENHNLNGVYLCVNQNIIGTVNAEEIGDTFIGTQLNISDIIEKCTSLIASNLYQRRCLTKQDILYKFAQLVVSNFEMQFKSQNMLSLHLSQINSWEGIIQDKIITIVESSKETLEFLSEYIRNKVKNFCNNSNFNSWTENLSKGEQNMFYQENKYLETKMCHENLQTYLDVYKLLWTNKKLPVILEINSIQDYMNIQKVLKLMDNPFRVIVVTTDLQILHLEFGDKLEIFESLQDLDEDKKQTSLKLPVSLQGRACDLETILDEATFPFVKCRDIIQILLGNFSIDNQFRLPKNVLERNYSRVFIELHVLDEIQDECFLIEDADKCFDSLIIKNSKISYLDDIQSVSPGIIVCQNIVTLEQLEKLKSTSHVVHHLVIHNTRYLEWKNTLGSIEKIKMYRVELDDVEVDVINKFSKPVTIISGAPGMGKSTLMKTVPKHAPPGKWILRVDLNRHQNYYKSFHKNNINAIAHLNYFQEEIFARDGPSSELTRRVFKKLVQSKDVIVLLDGFDEISVCYKEEVTNIAKMLHSEDYQIWISTRPVMKQYLEDIFNTFSVDLKPLTFDNQKYVLTKHFSKSILSSADLIAEFVEKLLEMSKRNLKGDQVEFLGVPLHIKLLADVFQVECENFVYRNGVATAKETFDLLYLYENYVENRMNVLCDKFHAVEQNDRVMFKEHQSLFALKLLFPFHDHQEVDKAVEYYRNKPDKLQLLQREGLITIDEKLNVNFAHRTFAEYLAAKWLSENVQTEKAQNLIKERFNRNYKFLFNTFDRFLAVGCPLHLCIINNKIEEAKIIIKSDPVSFRCTDKSGRSVLHLLALYGVEFPLLFHEYSQFYPSSEGSRFLNLKLFEKDAMLEIIEQIPDCKILSNAKDILGYNPLDYALANNCLAVAEKIHEKLKLSTVNANINVNYKKSYLGYCVLLNYTSLYNLLLPYFVSKDFLFKNVSGDVTVNTYFQNIYSNNAYTKSILKHKIDFGTMSIINLLSKCSYTSYIKDHYSDLHYAIIFNSKDNVEELLNETTEINLQDQENNTPLHYTALFGHNQIAKLLLEKHAKVDIQNDSADTALHIALREHQTEIAKMLLDNGASGNIQNKRGETPLHSAIQRNYQDIVYKITASGEVNDKQNDTGNTPLHLALKKLQVDTARIILSNGSDGNISNKMGETSLHYSIQYGYSDIAQGILSKGVLNNKQNVDGNTPLQLALIHGMPEIAELLITNGADVGIENLRGEIALHGASQRGYKDIVEQILFKLKSDNKKNIDGYTALHPALMKNAVSTAEVLVSNGADVNVGNKNSETALHCTVQSDQNDIVETMLSTNVATGKRNLDGNTPLHFALMKNETDIEELLVSDAADINVTNNKQETSLHCAMQNSKPDLAGMFISKCTLINKQNVEAETPLHLAVKKCYHNMVPLFIANGAYIDIANKKHQTVLHLLIETGYNGLHEILATGVINNQQNDDGNTPLHLALITNQSETARLLISNGACVNTENNNAENSLHCATQYGCSNLVVSILSKDVALDNTSIHGNTALHMALLKRDLNTVKLLLSAGANANIENCKGDTALSYALENGYDNIVVKQMLSNSTIDNKWVKDGNSLLHLALMKGHLEAAELLIAYGADINKENRYRETPLLLAMQNGYLDTASKIISKSNVNVRKRKDGNTPLHWALVRKNIEIAKSLITNGANINLGNRNGKTALHCAAKNGYHDMVIQLLLAEGANINQQNKNGNTPLHVAAWKGYTETVKLLLFNGADINMKNKKSRTVMDLAHERSNSEVMSLIEQFKKEHCV